MAKELSFDKYLKLEKKNKDINDDISNNIVLFVCAIIVGFTEANYKFNLIELLAIFTLSTGFIGLLFLKQSQVLIEPSREKKIKLLLCPFYIFYFVMKRNIKLSKIKRFTKLKLRVFKARYLKDPNLIKQIVLLDKDKSDKILYEEKLLPLIRKRLHIKNDKIMTRDEEKREILNKLKEKEV